MHLGCREVRKNVEIIAYLGEADSTSEAERLIQQGGLK